MNKKSFCAVLLFQKMSSQVSTSPSLLIRLRDAADHDAWSTFHQIYLPIIHSYCLRWGLQQADADDITQEVLASVFRSIPSFEYEPNRGRFRSWLGTVTANEIKSWYERAKKRGNNHQTATIDWNAVPKLSPEWSVIFTEHVFRAACQRVRAQCEPQTWQCFEATWVQRKSASEVARETGLPIHSVYVNKSRILQRLEQEVRLLSDDLPLDLNSPTCDADGG